MGLLDRMISNTLSSVSYSAGNAIGEAVGNLAGEKINSYTTDMKVANEQKMMAVEEQKKINDRPATCPHCGAPTEESLICGYCNCKIVE